MTVAEESESAAAIPRPPNIVVVLSDQQRPDSCGVFGQRLPVTPVLDRLAGRGVAFDNAFTVQPVCGPARAAIQTGQMPTEAFAGHLVPSATRYRDAHLYDNRADPHQRNNLARDPSTVQLRRQLADRLIGHIERVERESPEIIHV